MEFNPYLPAVVDNPYPYYAYLRKHAPVYQVPGVGFWVVSRYDDVLSLFKNYEVFASNAYAVCGELNPFPAMAPALTDISPPVYTRQRRLVNRAFTPRRIASLESRMAEIVGQVLEPLAARGECDLIADFASLFPGTVIAELLGVPPERQPDFRRWSDDVVRALNSVVVPAEEHAEIRQSIMEFREYLRILVELYRRWPGDNLISDLVRVEEEQQMLTAEEIVSLAVIILLGGNETTTNLIGSATHALLTYPQEFAKVRANPALIPNLVEETLRYDGPLVSAPRQRVCETEMAGTQLPAGAMVLPLLNSANRDENKFPDPDRFDLLHDTEGHVGFGFGIHYCLGAQLARLEGQVALGALLARFPHLAQKQDEPVTRVQSIIVRGLKTLPLILQ